MSSTTDVVVVGGGVVGLWSAFLAARSGADVVLLDPAPGRGASWAAAGMLAPFTEYGYGEEDLLALNLAASRDYPDAMATLREASGSDPGYRRTGALEVAWDGADLAGLRDLNTRRTALGLASELLTGRELRRVEPGLATGLPGGVLARDDHQVDNRRMIAALLAALAASGVAVRTAAVDELLVTDRRVAGVDVGGEVVRAGHVVLAAGVATPGLRGLPENLRVPVRPVKGQTLRLHSDEPVLDHVVRGRVRGVPVYVVPRSDGEIVVGASSEEAGHDVTPRVGAVHDLLRDAMLLVPGLAEATWGEVATGLRPGTPDNGPVVGRTDVAGLLLATGHYRGGVLLAPFTGAAVATLLAGGDVPAELAPFGAQRFSREEVSA